MTAVPFTGRRGVMLLEMLITIGLLAIFLVLAGKLFATTLRLTHAWSAAAREVAAYESCVAALRRDVWGAVDVTAPAGGGGMRITRGEGTPITWSAEQDGALVRQEGAAVQRWPGLGAKVALHPDPDGMRLRAGEDELRLTSQVLLARKGAP